MRSFNLALIGAAGHGKTTILKKLGVTAPDGVTTRLFCYRKDDVILIDTPGHVELLEDRQVAMKMAHVILLVVNVNQRLNDVVKEALELEENENFLVAFTRVDEADNLPLRISQLTGEIRSVRQDFDELELTLERPIRLTMPKDLSSLLELISRMKVSLSTDGTLGWSLAASTCVGFGSGIEVIRSTSEGDLNLDSVYLGDQKLTVKRVKVGLKDRDMSNPISSNDSEFWMLANGVGDLLLQGTSLTCEPGFKLPSNNMKVWTGRYNVSLVAETSSNLRSMHRVVSDFVALSEVDVGVISASIGAVPRGIQATVTAERWSTISLKAGGRGMSEMIVSTFRIFDEIMLNEIEHQGKVRVLKNFGEHGNAVLFGVKVLGGEVHVGSHILCKKQLFAVRSIRVITADRISVSSGDEAGLMVESMSAPKVGDLLAILDYSSARSLMSRRRAMAQAFMDVSHSDLLSLNEG